MTLAASTCGLLRTGASSRQYPTGRQGAVFFRSLGFSRSRSDARYTPVRVPAARAHAPLGIGGPGRRIRAHAHPPAARELARVRVAVAVAAFSSSSDLPYHLVVGMPALSPTMESGTLSEWKVEEGGSFGAGDSLAEIQTDKASIDFEAQDDGFVARHLVPPGTEAAVGQPIMVTVEEEEYVAAFKDFVVPPAAAVADGGGESATAGATAPPPSVASLPADADEPLPPSAASASGSASLLFPSARHLAESRNLDATVLRGSGKGGRVTKGDVLAAIAGGATLPPLPAAGVSAVASGQQRQQAANAPAAPAPAPAAAAPSVVVSVPDASPSGSYEDVPNNNMRKVIARRLTESKRDVPHFYTSADIELDAVLNLRKYLASNHDVKVSVNDFILKSSAMALRDVPEVNASYDVKTGSIGMNPDVDISVAVATPTGLITPIVKSVDRIGLADVTARVRDLATRARDGKLLPEEYQGGSFTVSNLGMFGVDEFSAVINPPQCAILAVGGGSRRIVPTPYVEDDGERAERVVARPGIRTVMTARLSSDRRVVDEPTASLFMQALTHYLSTPNLLLL